MLTINERVQAGAELLDKERPDWMSHIDVDRIRMESCADCILGQLYDYYTLGVEVLELELSDVVRYGFAVGEGCISEEEWLRYDQTGQWPKWFEEKKGALAEAWKAEIEKRVI